MNLYDLGNGRILFVLENKELKKIKHSPVPIEMIVAKDDRRVSFSFTSREAFDKQMKGKKLNVAPPPAKDPTPNSGDTDAKDS